MEPMLAGKADTKKLDKLSFPLWVSPKLDGIRALVVDGILMSRSFKPIPNRYLQEKFSKLPNGTDGELIKGLPTEDPYRATVSAVMTEDGEPTDVSYFVFDNFSSPGGFSQRYRVVEHMNSFEDGVISLPHQLVGSLAELLVYEEEVLTSGYEGVMLRSPNGPYKFGRSTAKEGHLLKLKRFEDSEAVILDTEELMHNDNAAQDDAFGRTERSNHKAGMRASGVLGALVVRGLEGTHKDVEFNIGSGFNGAADVNGERAKLWREREALIGKIVKFKYFPIGSKDKPRFPTFLGFRDKIDL